MTFSEHYLRKNIDDQLYYRFHIPQKQIFEIKNIVNINHFYFQGHQFRFNFQYHHRLSCLLSRLPAAFSAAFSVALSAVSSVVLSVILSVITSAVVSTVVSAASATVSTTGVRGRAAAFIKHAFAEITEIRI